MWASKKLHWYGWLLKGLKDLSNQNTKQLFWIFMAAKAKGLSNTESFFNLLVFSSAIERMAREETTQGASHSTRKSSQQRKPRISRCAEVYNVICKFNLTGGVQILIELGNEDSPQAPAGGIVFQPHRCLLPTTTPDKVRLPPSRLPHHKLQGSLGRRSQSMWSILCPVKSDRVRLESIQQPTNCGPFLYPHKYQLYRHVRILKHNGHSRFVFGCIRLHYKCSSTDLVQGQKMLSRKKEKKRRVGPVLGKEGGGEESVQ